jgi:hypothetical protein
VNELILAVASSVITAAVFLLRAGRSEGRFEQKVEEGLRRLGEQINGVGKKVNDNQIATDKRIRNLSVIVQFCSPDDKEKDVASLLKE